MTSDQCFSYRFGFNGQERDDEVSGEGNSYTAEFWQYDSRLGRRFNVDPVVKVHESPYACFANNPIWIIDPNGADSFFYDYQLNLMEDTKTEESSHHYFVFDTDGELKRYGGSYRAIEERDLYTPPKVYTGDVTIEEIRSAQSGEVKGDDAAGLAPFSLDVMSTLTMSLSNTLYDSKTKMWLASNGKSYLNAVKEGNTYIFEGGKMGSRKEVIKTATKLKYISRFLTGLNFAMTHAEYEMATRRYLGPNMQEFLWHRCQINQAVNGVGLMGWKGTVFSLTYGSGTLVESLCNCNIQYNPITNNFTPLEETLIKYDNLGIDLNINYMFSIEK